MILLCVRRVEPQGLVDAPHAELRPRRLPARSRPTSPRRGRSRRRPRGRRSSGGSGPAALPPHLVSRLPGPSRRLLELPPPGFRRTELDRVPREPGHADDAKRGLVGPKVWRSTWFCGPSCRGTCGSRARCASGSELRVDLREVRLDRADTDEQTRGHLLIGETLGNEIGDPPLCLGQLRRGRPASWRVARGRRPPARPSGPHRARRRARASARAWRAQPPAASPGAARHPAPGGCVRPPAAAVSDRVEKRRSSSAAAGLELTAGCEQETSAASARRERPG